MSRRPGDLAYAFVGWFLLGFGPVVALVDLVAPASAHGRTPFLVAGAVALPAAVAHWLSGRSIGPLGATLFWAAALGVSVGLPLLFLARSVGAAPFAAPPVRLAGVTALYAAAAALAVRREPGRDREPAA